MTMTIDYNKITKFITNFEMAEKLIEIYNSTKNVVPFMNTRSAVLGHFNHVMDANWELIESFTEEELEYGETLCELWKGRKVL